MLNFKADGYAIIGIMSFFEKRYVHAAAAMPAAPVLQINSSINSDIKKNVKIKADSQRQSIKSDGEVLSSGDEFSSEISDLDTSQLPKENAVEQKKTNRRKRREVILLSDSDDEDEVLIDVGDQNLRNAIETDPAMLRLKQLNESMFNAQKKQNESNQMNLTEAAQIQEVEEVVLEDLVVQETAAQIVERKLNLAKSRKQTSVATPEVRKSSVQSKTSIRLKFRFLPGKKSKELDEKKRSRITVQEVFVEQEELMSIVIARFWEQCVDEDLNAANRKKVKFMFDGEAIPGNDTVAGLDLEGDEIIDVIF